MEILIPEANIRKDQEENAPEFFFVFDQSDPICDQRIRCESKLIKDEAKVLEKFQALARNLNCLLRQELFTL